MGLLLGPSGTNPSTLGGNTLTGKPVANPTADKTATLKMTAVVLTDRLLALSLMPLPDDHMLLATPLLDAAKMSSTMTSTPMSAASLETVLSLLRKTEAVLVPKLTLIRLMTLMKTTLVTAKSK